MGEKKNQSLKERIAALINRVGEKPEPTFGYIKSALVDCLGMAEALENGVAVSEAEAQVAALEAALEESNAQLANLKIELQSANAEIETFRAEQKKREEQNQDIPPIQLKILRELPTEHGDYGLTMDGISRHLCIPLDETEIHVEFMENAGLVAWEYDKFGQIAWQRTKSGNKLVVAKRLAGEEEATQKKYKHPDLPPIQHEILLLIAAGQNEGANENDVAETLGKTLGLVRYNLRALEAADMAGDPGQPDYGAGRTFYLRDTGANYLAERDLL